MNLLMLTMTNGTKLIQNPHRIISNIRDEFKTMKDFELDKIEAMMREQLKKLDLKPKEGFQAARVAITGTKISPPLFESIYALGQSSTIARIAEKIDNL